MAEVFRIFVEKKKGNDIEARHILDDLKTNVGITALEDLRLINRYDAQGLSREEFDEAARLILSEPNLDNIYTSLEIEDGWKCFATEFLPGQYDQRADSAAQCIQLLTAGERPEILSAKIIAVKGDITDQEFNKIKAYIINPVESREASMALPETLDIKADIPADIARIDGFIEKTDEEIADYHKSMGFAMSIADLCWVRDYFKTEKRNPSLTELKVIDTYWSDHCRHTTFSTKLDSITVEKSKYAKAIEDALSQYFEIRKEVYGTREKDVCLMDMACIGTKVLKKRGEITNLDESEEINACSIEVPVVIDGKEEQWLVQFKNETHNHPTEIEPFGGAATCLGGAIRDPLSGRAYVYQAMRVTGCGDPTVSFEDTLDAKLPQRKITTGAAQGYSSYGNQIGLATGQVTELYDDGYVAKRMEIGAVIGASPKENVIREVPQENDIIVLLGGRTGRDGCGGATGSSKAHNSSSIETCGAEVQKGNPPTERKIQRLFRKAEAAKMIKRCNDFGAGGVSVAIGELTDGLEIDLNAVPKKYDGLDGTEIAISESQERMAVVVAKEDAEKFLQAAGKENLEATIVAEVKAEPRLKMHWNGKNIVNLSREFLNSNGAAKYTDVVIPAPKTDAPAAMPDCAESWKELLSNLNVCSQKGLVEMFDSTIGAGTVLMPFGGAYQLTPSQAMAAKIPVLRGETNTCSLMGWGYNPLISERSPYHGAMCAVVESVAKIVAAGGSWHHCWLTFQEYFERTQNNPERWGKPMAALLGAFQAQLELSCGAIGGKDSMSGTFEQIDVPPTLVSFAVSTAKADHVVSTEFKNTDSKVILVKPTYLENGLPDFDSIRACFDQVEAIIRDNRAAAIWAVDFGGVAEGIAKMCFGNFIGFRFTKQLTPEELFQPCCGAFVIELNGDAKADETVIGTTTNEQTIVCPNYTMQLPQLLQIWEKKLEPVFPCRIKTTTEKPPVYSYNNPVHQFSTIKTARPNVLIPVFPGTNCEYDTARIFERAGARAEVFVIRNLSAAAITESVEAFTDRIKNAQIIMIPGGFSGGDEPEGSGKFITAFFRNPKIMDAVHNLLQNRDGLMLGICNGFQALIKLGLVPFGKIVEMEQDAPTLTFNTIARHQSMLVTTRVASTKSPWLYGCEVGDLHTVAISHGEGRFVAPPALIEQLAENGQIATQYVDLDGNPTMDIHYNPNTSMMAIEGITSPDGRVFGKMGHSERIGTNLYRNVPGEKDQKIFQSGVAYFR